jgi:RES domain-containing protein
MRVWRISAHADMEGLGGLLVSGRWHTQGHRILYCAENPATALLETLVHQEIDQTEIPTFQYLAVDIPDEISLETVRPSRLPRTWGQQLSITRAFGDQWLRDVRSPLLKVPSVLAPETWNILVNPQHTACRNLTISSHYHWSLDRRLASRRR